MSLRTFPNPAYVLACAALVLPLAACAPTAAPAAPSEESKETGTAQTENGSGDDATTSNRPGVIMLAESAFAGFNGAAHWDGDTLVMALDGDVNAEEDAALACGILDAWLEDGESARLEFPNGTLDCPAG